VNGVDGRDVGIFIDACTLALLSGLMRRIYASKEFGVEGGARTVVDDNE
jgi:hypothetical protein